MNSDSDKACDVTVEGVAKYISRPNWQADEKTLGICALCGKRLSEPTDDYGPVYYCDRMRSLYDQAGQLVELWKHQERFNELCPKLYRQIDSRAEAREESRARRIDWKAYDKALAWDYGQGSSLMLCGDSGAGKSTAMWHILRKVHNLRVGWEIYSGRKLADAYFRACRDGAGEAFVQRLVRLPVLVFDDFGKEQIGEAVSSLIFEVINSRCEECLPTLITTRFRSDSLPQRFEKIDITKGTDLVRRFQDYFEIVVFRDQTITSTQPKQNHEQTR
ncbi:MAG: ATP-binding protein [Verrucomicrobiota bacterium JB024]|nr:ATP-binding protein [Verrucomicrobiota bacterium JB024]